MHIHLLSLSYERNEEKNQKLKNERGVCFEDVVEAIQQGDVLDIIPHPNPAYAHQYLLIVLIREYPHVVPFVLNDSSCFFKTIFPSRKHKQ